MVELSSNPQVNMQLTVLQSRGKPQQAARVGYSDRVKRMEHANGARSLIAQAMSGAQEPTDYWYEEAADLLDELRVNGFVVNPSDNPSEQRTAYVVSSADVDQSTVERVYLDRDEAQRFADAFNAHKPPFKSEMYVDEFPIGAPEVEYDGLIWVGTWTQRRKVEGERQLITTDGNLTTVYPSVVPRPGGYYAYREHFAPQYVEYAEPPEWIDEYQMRQEWHTGDQPPDAEIQLRQPGDYPRVEARGTEHERVEAELRAAADQVKAERA